MGGVVRIQTQGVPPPPLPLPPVLQDLWALDLPTLEWRALPALPGQPHARTGHAAVVHGNKMWVFGGFAQLPDKSKLLMSGPICLDLATGAWARPATAPARAPAPAHAHEPLVPPVDGVSAMDDAVFRCMARIPPVRRACTTPHTRSMACAFVHGDHLFVVGGRDRPTTVVCDFYLALPRRHQTLQGLVAQYVVDHRVPCGGAVPPAVAELLAGLHRRDAAACGAWASDRRRAEERTSSLFEGIRITDLPFLRGPESGVCNAAAECEAQGAPH